MTIQLKSSEIIIENYELIKINTKLNRLLHVLNRYIIFSINICFHIVDKQ